MNWKLTLFLYMITIAQPARILCSGADEPVTTSGNNEITSVEELSRQVTEKMNAIKTISFSFMQNTFIADSTQTIRAEVLFKKPDNLKIRYHQPQVQEIYSSNGYLYTYIPEIRQATRQKIDNIDDLLGITPSVILSSDSFRLLKKGFKLRLTTSPKSKNSISLEPLPVNTAGFDSMVITFNNNTGLPEMTVVTAPNFKSITLFTDYTVNPDLDKARFDFNPGNNVNIINID